MILLDTSGVIAAYNQRDAEHAAARDVLTGTTEPMVISPLVLAEVDYLAAKYLGPSASVVVLSELEQLATVASFTNEDLRAATRLVSQYLDLNIGLTDAVNVVLAGRYKTTSLLSLDGHYRAIKPTHGDHFTLLPAGTTTGH
ncbi:MAG: type II toxin-antitoxin system VapC family toxin [Micromonosporaceae bacterium]